MAAALVASPPFREAKQRFVQEMDPGLRAKFLLAAFHDQLAEKPLHPPAYKHEVTNNKAREEERLVIVALSCCLIPVPVDGAALMHAVEQFYSCL